MEEDSLACQHVWIFAKRPGRRRKRQQTEGENETTLFPNVLSWFKTVKHSENIVCPLCSDVESKEAKVVCSVVLEHESMF